MVSDPRKGSAHLSSHGLVLHQRHPHQWGVHWLGGLLSRDDGVLVHGVCLGHNGFAREETLDEGID